MSCDVSRLRYRGGSVLVPALPICLASRFTYLVISCCLLGSSALPHPSSHPSSRAILLACRHASRFTARPASRFSSRSSPRSPLGDAIAALPDRSPCCSACGHRLPRHACRGTGSGAGRVAFLVIVCPPCRRCLLWMASRLRAFPRCGLLARFRAAVCVGNVMAKLYI